MFHNLNFKIMESNVKITANTKEFKNGQNGYEVKVVGMDGKLDCKMNFHEPLKAMRYMFVLAKRLELQIDTVQLAALSLAYQRAKMAAQKAAEDAASVIAEVGEAEKEDDSASPAGEDVKEVAPSTAEQSPIVKQFLELKDKHPDALLLFRCGDFYESYMHDAEVCAEVLGITLTKRSGEKVSMAGFPYTALDTYLPKLIRAGHRVAICDQIEDPKEKALVKQGITDMIAPAKPEQPAEPAAPKRRERKPKAQKELNLEVAC